MPLSASESSPLASGSSSDGLGRAGTRDCGSGGFGSAPHLLTCTQRSACSRPCPVLTEQDLFSKFRSSSISKRLHDRVLCEARAIVALQHPNIVRYYTTWLEVKWKPATGAARQDVSSGAADSAQRPTVPPTLGQCLADVQCMHHMHKGQVSDQLGCVCFCGCAQAWQATRRRPPPPL